MGIPGLIPYIKSQHSACFHEENVDMAHQQVVVGEVATQEIKVLMAQFKDREQGSRTPAEFVKKFLKRFLGWATRVSTKDPTGQDFERLLVFVSDNADLVPLAKKKEQLRRRRARLPTLEAAKSEGKFIDYPHDVVFTDFGPELDAVSLLAQGWAMRALNKYLREALVQVTQHWPTRVVIDIPVKGETAAVVCGAGKPIETIPGSNLGEGERSAVHWIKRIYSPGSTLLPKTSAYVCEDPTKTKPTASIVTVDSDIVAIAYSIPDECFPPKLIWDSGTGSDYIVLNELFSGWKKDGVNPKAFIVATCVLGNDYLERNKLVNRVNPPTSFARAMRLVRDEGTGKNVNVSELVRRLVHSCHCENLHIHIAASRSAEAKTGMSDRVTHSLRPLKPPALERRTIETIQGLVTYWSDVDHPHNNAIPVFDDEEPVPECSPAPAKRPRKHPEQRITVQDLEREADLFF